MITYLSPTSLDLFEQDKSEFYLRYMSPIKRKRMPQTKPMSVGSAFDAYVKSFLVEHLYGKQEPGSKYDFTTLFKAQVEPANWEWAKEAGLHCFNSYKESGALSDLLLEMSGTTNAKFEFDVKGVIKLHEETPQREGVTKTVDGVPFNGKPDAYFINGLGARVVLDWKVNGYCSSRSVSPESGYVTIRDGYKSMTPSKNNNSPHKSAQVMFDKGINVNIANYFESVSTSWGTQLAIYAWLLGEQVGSDFIVGLDQLACKPSSVDLGFGDPQPVGKPHIRVASFRARISRSFQLGVLGRAHFAWEVIQSGHLFREMTREQSDARCKLLDEMNPVDKQEGPTGDVDLDWFNDATKKRW